MDNDIQEKTEQTEKTPLYKVAEGQEDSPIIEEEDVIDIKDHDLNLIVEIILWIAAGLNFCRIFLEMIRFSSNIFYDESPLYIFYSGLRRAIVCAILVIMAERHSRKATIAFFIFTLVDLIIICTAGHNEFKSSLFVAIVVCIAMRLLLMIRKNGVSAWKVLMAKPAQDPKTANLK